MRHPDTADAGEAGQARHWFLRGVLAAVSIPALILATAFVGFAGLAREAGFSLAEILFMIAVVWALPAKVVLIGAVLAGNALPAVAFAVALSSIRLTPMVVALVPEMRGPRTRPWVLYALSHFVAVTSWVIALETIRGVPRDLRTTYYCGLGLSLVLFNMVVAAVTYLVAGSLPPAVAAGLLLLTPIYFLTSLWGSAREQAGKVAMVAGLALGPVAHMLVPGFDLLAAGFVGGVCAYLWHRFTRQAPA
ncbi:MAG: AzlC family ABC transporter permease [Rhizobiaceae bacterium]|nr:AzlC family ABC transporter permease [Rhizobiaceae bacterium]MCV0405219.1 AzlC family ABC transporter permease [Rhizobiaceae bacterium]